MEDMNSYIDKPPTLDPGDLTEEDQRAVLKALFGIASV